MDVKYGGAGEYAQRLPAIAMPSKSFTPSGEDRAKAEASISDAGRVLETEVLGHDRLHDLRGAAVDRGDPRVGVGAGDGVLAHVAVAAEELQTPVHDALLQLRAPPLRARGVRYGQLPRQVPPDTVIHIGLSD